MYASPSLPSFFVEHPHPASAKSDFSADLRAAGFALAPHERVFAAVDSPLAQGIEAWHQTIGSRGLAAVGEVIFGANQAAFEALCIAIRLGLQPQEGWANIHHQWARQLPAAATAADQDRLHERLGWLAQNGFNLHAGLADVLDQQRVDLIPALLHAGASAAQSNRDGINPAQLLIEHALRTQPNLDAQKHALVTLMQQGVPDATRLIGMLSNWHESPVSPELPCMLASCLIACAYHQEAWAQAALGVMMKEGLLGLEADEKKAVEWFEKAAAQGNAEANTQLGLMARAGQGMDRDDSRAVLCFARASEKGDAYARYLLAHALLAGTGVRQDRATGLALLQTAADQWFAEAQCEWALYMLIGQEVPANPDRAIWHLGAAARQGHVGALRTLSQAFTHGWGVPRNLEVAARCCEGAAMQNDAQAQYDLGIMHEQGQGVRRDLHTALALWQHAARQGHLEAKNRLGEACLRGEGTPPDYKTAYRWFRSAAGGGLARAQHNLAWMHATGRLGAVQKGPTLNWLKKAATQGFAPALFDLAIAFASGWGVARNDYEAAALLERAACLDDPRAQKTLSEFFASGRGVQRNLESAKFWRERAARQGMAASPAGMPMHQALPSTPQKTADS